MTRLGIILAAVALVVAACGGDSDPPGPVADGAPAPASTGPAATNGPADATRKLIELSAENIAFSTSSLEAGAGEVTIRFANNDDGVPHNLHVTGAGVDQKTDIEPGPVTQLLGMTLASGTYTYVCDVHPQQMTGQLTIA